LLLPVISFPRHSIVCHGSLRSEPATNCAGSPVRDDSFGRFRDEEEKNVRDRIESMSDKFAVGTCPDALHYEIRKKILRGRRRRFREAGGGAGAQVICLHETVCRGIFFCRTEDPGTV